MNIVHPFCLYLNFHFLFFLKISAANLWTNWKNKSAHSLMRRKPGNKELNGIISDTVQNFLSPFIFTIAIYLNNHILIIVDRVLVNDRYSNIFRLYF